MRGPLEKVAATPTPGDHSIIRCVLVDDTAGALDFEDYTGAKRQFIERIHLTMFSRPDRRTRTSSSVISPTARFAGSNAGGNRYAVDRPRG